MKKKIIIGSLSAVFMLLMLPSVSAVEFNTVVETNKSQILEQIKNIDINEFKEKFQNINKLELRQRIFKELQEHKHQFAIDSEPPGYILYNVITFILEMIVWFISKIMAIPELLYFLFYPLTIEP